MDGGSGALVVAQSSTFRRTAATRRKAVPRLARAHTMPAPRWRPTAHRGAAISSARMRRLHLTTGGESHGPGLTAMLTDCPRDCGSTSTSSPATCPPPARLSAAGGGCRSRRTPPRSAAACAAARPWAPPWSSGSRTATTRTGKRSWARETVDPAPRRDAAPQIAAARAHRPRGRDQVPAPRPARHPRARLGPRDHRPRRRRRLRPHAARRVRDRDPQRRPLAGPDRRRRAGPRPGRICSRSTRPRRCAPSTASWSPRWSASSSAPRRRGTRWAAR